MASDKRVLTKGLFGCAPIVGTNGGARHCCFSEDVRLTLEHRIAEVVRDNPLLYLKEIQGILEQEFPLKVNVCWIFRALARFGALRCNILLLFSSAFLFVFL